MALSKSDILNADDMPTEEVNVPEWGGTVIISTMTSTARDAYEAEMYHANKAQNGGEFVNLRARMVARCARDEQGELLFTDDDIEALGKKSAAALDRCYEVAERLNKFSEEDIAELSGESVSVQS